MIPGARLERIEHSRAFVPWDQPERLAELIPEFVWDIRARPARSGAAAAA
jgi:hypothetical protein